MCYLNIDETVRKEDGGGGEENEPPEEYHCCHRSTLGPDYNKISKISCSAHDIMICQRIITDANVRILVILKMIKLIVFFQIKMSFEL